MGMNKMASAKTYGKSAVELTGEHQEMMRKLAELDAALESLICYSEVYADLAGVQHAQSMAKWLVQQLPEHFQEEERGILAEIARLGPEFAAFSREMKRQHQQIDDRVKAFCQAANTFQDAADLQQCISDLKEAGKSLATFMATHMGAEERKYASLK